MANALYTSYKTRMLTSGLDMTSAAINVVLVDTATYSVDLEIDDNYTGIAGGAVLATGTLGSKAVITGSFDAADVTFSSVTGAESEAVVIYYDDAGNEANSTLIAYIDTATNLPVTPNGGDITVSWGDKIYRF